MMSIKVRRLVLSKLFTLPLLFYLNFAAHSQAMKAMVKRSKESIKSYDVEDYKRNRRNLFYPAGYEKDYIIYIHHEEDDKISFFTLNESSDKFEGRLPSIDAKSRHIYPVYNSDSVALYAESFFTSVDDDGYTKVLFWYNGKNLQLDSMHYADKKVRASFSLDSKYLIVNTLSELYDYYVPEVDNQFYFYYVDSLKQGKLSRQTVPCGLCADSYLVGDQLFFTKAEDHDVLWDSKPDVYVAPWGRIQDSVKIIASSDIAAISSDGKYILAYRGDIANGALAIVDVTSKKYQLLLGRDYNDYSRRAFYSQYHQKFAFDMDGHIVYVDFPEEYPFDALRRDNPLVPFDLDLTPYQHPPLR
jgi:hypothetical protein